MDDVDPPPPSSNSAVGQFLTTEHFNLQTERIAANADTNARLQLFMSSITATIITLALASQFSGGDAFRGFALILLPTVYVFGLVSLGRLTQTWAAWFAASQGMGRIRRYFVDNAPEIEPYLVMPTTDDPWRTLAGAGVGEGAKGHWYEGLYTAPAAISIVNSVVAGVFLGVVAATMTDSRALQAALGSVGFLLSAIGMFLIGTRGFFTRMANADVRFPETLDRP